MTQPTNVTPKNKKELDYFYRTKDGTERRAFEIGEEHVKNNVNPFEDEKSTSSRGGGMCGGVCGGWYCGLDILFD